MTFTSPDFQKYEAAHARLRARRAELFPQKLAAVLQALSLAGIQAAAIEFDGGGDEGQIESIECFAASGSAVTMPDAAYEVIEVCADTLEVVRNQQSLAETLESISYYLLEQSHAGWETNEGAFGSFVFDTETQSVTLDFCKRYTDCKNYQHIFRA